MDDEMIGRDLSSVQYKGKCRTQSWPRWRCCDTRQHVEVAVVGQRDIVEHGQAYVEGRGGSDRAKAAVQSASVLPVYSPLTRKFNTYKGWHQRFCERKWRWQELEYQKNLRSLAQWKLSQKRLHRWVLLHGGVQRKWHRGRCCLSNGNGGRAASCGEGSVYGCYDAVKSAAQWPIGPRLGF